MNSNLRNKKMTFVLAACLCCCAVANPHSTTRTVAHDWPENCYERTDLGEEVAMQFNPSMLELVLHPSTYDGCHVILQGFMGHFRAGKFMLYLTRDDILIQGSLFGTTFVDLKDHESQLDLENIANMNGKLVLVDGVFSKAAPGLEVPRITKVRRVSLTERRTDGAP